MKNKDIYILGINGLGVLPSACIIKNNELIAMAEEERFTRLKGSIGMMPGRAVSYCLKEANIKIENVHYIAFGWDANFYKWKMPLFMAKTAFSSMSSSKNKGGFLKALNELVKYHPAHVKDKIICMFREQGIQGKIPPVKFVNHHLSHAASTYFSSGYTKAFVLVIDGSGENQSTTIWRANKNDLTKIYSAEIPNSLGWFYQAITEFLGFTPNNHEGKTMALAALGEKNDVIFEQFEKILRIDNNCKNLYRFNYKYAFGGNHSKGNVFSQQLEELLGPCRQKNEPISKRHKDIAFAAQFFLEKIVLHLIEEKIFKHPDFNGNLCLAGGVSLNCKLNGKIAAQLQIKNIYIPPFSSDNGTALGAAQFVMSKELQLFEFNPIKHAYWGPSFSNASIQKLLEKLNIAYTKEANIAKKTAELLCENKVVAWFQGRMEVGSRALGNRSILANPTNKNARDIVNLKVKNRELWRPFAASILNEEKKSFTSSLNESPFMTLAVTVKKEMAGKIPAVIHEDLTTRPQFVIKENHKIYHELIKHFGDKSGIYAVLNTSFNTCEEPIICTPEQAIKAFFATEIDCLVMGDFLVTKSG